MYALVGRLLKVPETLKEGDALPGFRTDFRRA